MFTEPSISDFPAPVSPVKTIKPFQSPHLPLLLKPNSLRVNLKACFPPFCIFYFKVSKVLISPALAQCWENDLVTRNKPCNRF